MNKKMKVNDNTPQPKIKKILLENKQLNSFPRMLKGQDADVFAAILKYLKEFAATDSKIDSFAKKDILNEFVAFILDCSDLSIRSKGLNYLENQKYFDEIVKVLAFSKEKKLKMECAEILGNIVLINASESNLSFFESAAYDANQIIYSSNVFEIFQKRIKLHFRSK